MFIVNEIAVKIVKTRVNVLKESNEYNLRLTETTPAK
jgi:hypothetical protein